MPSVKGQWCDQNCFGERLLQVPRVERGKGASRSGETHGGAIGGLGERHGSLDQGIDAEVEKVTQG